MLSSSSRIYFICWMSGVTLALIITAALMQAYENLAFLLLIVFVIAIACGALARCIADFLMRTEKGPVD